MRVLVVDDDADLRTAISASLRAIGIAVDVAADLEDADRALVEAAYDGVVLDQSLPGGDALAYVAARRMVGWTVPVLFLTARQPVDDRVAGPAWGDDFLAKPFSMGELAGRVRGLARRGAIAAAPALRAGDLEIDLDRREVRRGGVPLALTAKEFAVLEALVTRLGQAVSRTELLAHAWDQSPHVLDMVIAQLRRKLGGRPLIETVRGVGYRLTVDSPARAGREESPPAPRSAGLARPRAVPRRRLGAARAFLDGLAGAISFGMPLHKPSSTGLTDAAVANIADAARRVSRAGADE